MPMKMKYEKIRCKRCMLPICDSEIHSEIIKSYKCPYCGTVNHYDGNGHVTSSYVVREITTASGKRFL